jgi:hypothetical protein
MGKSMPMYALDKVKTSLAIPADVVVKITKRAKERGVTVAQYINAMLVAHTHDDEWTMEDERKRQQIIKDNMRKRKALKAKAKKNGGR